GGAEGGGNTGARPRPAAAITSARSPSTSTIDTRSNASSPPSSRMKALNASSTTSEEASARAHLFAASSRSTRRPSSSRSCSASWARAAAVSASRPRRFTSQPTISPVSRKIPNGKVTRSRRKPGPPNSDERHHSTKTRNGRSAIDRRTPPSTPYRSAASTTTRMSAHRTGVPYSYEYTVAYAAITHPSKTSATKPIHDAYAIRTSSHNATAPIANTAVVIHAYVS